MYQTTRRACCCRWASATTRSKWSSLQIGWRWRDETESSWSCLNGIDEGDERKMEMDDGDEREGKVEEHGEKVVDSFSRVVVVKKNVADGWGWSWNPICCAIAFLLAEVETKCPITHTDLFKGTRPTLQSQLHKGSFANRSIYFFLQFFFFFFSFWNVLLIPLFYWLNYICVL